MKPDCYTDCTFPLLQVSFDFHSKEHQIFVADQFSSKTKWTILIESPKYLLASTKAKLLGKKEVIIAFMNNVKYLIVSFWEV